MEQLKSLKVEEKVWVKLQTIKLKNRKTTMNEVIKDLIKSQVEK